MSETASKVIKKKCPTCGQIVRFNEDFGYANHYPPGSKGKACKGDEK